MKGSSVMAADVCVIIAVRNAAATIATAVTSALREPEVAEVVVVDDCSSDDTASAAEGADDATGRLVVLRLDVNRGPSFARNMAIEGSRSPLISILDGDDFFFGGRFRDILADADWDLAADNILFLPESEAADIAGISVPRMAADPEYLSLDRFIHGNISRRGARRGELGFLKPVISRAFLQRHGLRYDENLRLGEDYELYARAMACGARFKVIRSCGYGATVRADSLSGRHATGDLKRLADADLALLEIAGLPESSRAALETHERHIRDKYLLRNFLDIKAERGLAAAIGSARAHPWTLFPIAVGIAADKYDALMHRIGMAKRPAEPPSSRLLLGESVAAADQKSPA
jgi:succinoglycan biosynthesis protein ExoU